MARNNLFEIHGLTDLQKKLQYVVNSYPNESEILLTKMGNQFRNEVKKKTPQSDKQTKRKLIKSYRVSKVKGYGKDLYVEFRSTSPHFHLVERGHRIVMGDKDTGKRVQGKHMVKQTSVAFQKEFPEQVEKMVNRMVKKLL